jgi:hypothetical protein
MGNTKGSVKAMAQASGAKPAQGDAPKRGGSLSSRTP